MNKSFALILICLVIIFVAGIGYLIFQNQRLLSRQTSQEPSIVPSSMPSPVASNTPLTTVPPSGALSISQVQENIEASINSKNFATLASYMTKPKVNFSLMSSECCPPMTPDEVVKQLSYINDGIPFDFNQENSTIKNLKSKNPKLADAYIGISKNKEQLAAFWLNVQNRITDIQLAVTWKLYTY